MRDGFTLVEAIVVAVIIAALAAIAIPIYGGYLKDAQRGSAEDLARAGAAAASAFYRKKGTDPTVNQLNLSYDTTRMAVSIEDSALIVTVKNTNPVLGDTVLFR